MGGTTALQIDWVDDVYGSFPLMLGLISLITFVLLARAFRSLVLPAKAIAMNLLSVFATWGVVTLVWQEGFLTNALFGVDPTGSVAFWAPMIIFAFIYGCRWTTRCSSSPACARSTSAPGRRTRRSCAGSRAPDGWSPARR